MGRLQAKEMAGRVDLNTALHWHLSYNHYPPVPGAMVKPCKDAIEIARHWNEDDEMDELVDLPEGIQYKGRDDFKAPALALIEDYHLHDFLEIPDEELEESEDYEPSLDHEAD